MSDSNASLKSNSKYGSVDPVSVLQKCQRSSFRLVSSSAAFRNRSLRKPGFVRLHAGKVASAAATAASASSVDAAEDLYRGLSVRGETISIVFVVEICSPLRQSGTVQSGLPLKLELPLTWAIERC